MAKKSKQKKPSSVTSSTTPSSVPLSSLLRLPTGPVSLADLDTRATPGYPGIGKDDASQQIAALDPDEADPRSAASLAGKLYFAADDGVHGVELWRTDGTEAGTQLVRDFAPGASSGHPGEMVVVALLLAFLPYLLLRGLVCRIARRLGQAPSGTMGDAP